MITTRLEDARRSIAAAIEDSFNNTDSPFHSIDLWSSDVVERLRSYALRGKLIRGALVPFSYSLFQPNRSIPRAAVEVGVAMELLQSFLLIHDDIMDEDDVRRGAPAIHAQYRESLGTTGSSKADQPGEYATSARSQYGVSLGICVGDIAAFFAINVLSRIDVPDDLHRRLIERTSREIMLVGLAQMQDVHHGYVAEATQRAIWDVYTYKTGRYTFSMPMALGAMIAGVENKTVEALITLGEHLGRVFQIRDDRLGILEDAESTGKPTGSDIAADKKTIYRALLFERIDPDDPVRALFGRKTLGNDEIQSVRERLHTSGVIEDVDALVEREVDAAVALIEKLDLSDESRNELLGLIQFNRDRRT